MHYLLYIPDMYCAQRACAQINCRSKFGHCTSLTTQIFFVFRNHMKVVWPKTWSMWSCEYANAHLFYIICMSLHFGNVEWVVISYRIHSFYLPLFESQCCHMTSFREENGIICCESQFRLIFYTLKYPNNRLIFPFYSWLLYSPIEYVHTWDAIIVFVGVRICLAQNNSRSQKSRFCVDFDGIALWSCGMRYFSLSTISQIDRVASEGK